MGDSRPTHYKRKQRLYSDTDEPCFAVRLDYLLYERGICASYLVKHIGYNRNSITRWLNGYYDPPIDAVIKIAKYFDVSTDYLLGLKEDYI